MECYFTKNSNKIYFLIIINNLCVEIVDNRQTIWSGNVENNFIGENHLLDDLPEYIQEVEKGNSILLHLEKYKYMFIRNFLYTFETTDKIFKYCSNLGNNRVNYPCAYGEENVYFLIDRYEFIPYNTIVDENIKNMNLSYCPYDLLYNSNNGDRYKITNLNSIALRWYDENIEIDNLFDYVVRINDNNNNNLIIEYEDEDKDEDEILIYNGNNELVKTFHEKKCITCLENDSIFAFRNCGHLSVCESCYKNTDSDNLKKMCYLQILKLFQLKINIINGI